MPDNNERDPDNGQDNDARSNAEQNFFARWSERKLNNTPEREQDNLELNSASLSTKEQNERLAQQEAEHRANREAAEAIDIETLTNESDFQIFLKDGVPESLKQLALRKLWRTHPVFANLDGLNDYDENFANPNMIMETFDSAWKVGKGYFTKDESDKVKEANPAKATDRISEDTSTLENTAGLREESNPTDIYEDTDPEPKPDRKYEDEHAKMANAQPVEAHSAAEETVKERVEENEQSPQRPAHLSLRRRLEIDN